MDRGGGCEASESSSSSTLIASGDDDDGEEWSDTSDALVAAECLLLSEPAPQSSAILLLPRAAYALQRVVEAREIDAISVLFCESADAGVQFGSACQRPSTSRSLHLTPHTLHLNERK